MVENMLSLQVQKKSYSKTFNRTNRRINISMVGIFFTAFVIISDCSSYEYELINYITSSMQIKCFRVLIKPEMVGL